MYRVQNSNSNKEINMSRSLKMLNIYMFYADFLASYQHRRELDTYATVFIIIIIIWHELITTG